MSRCFLVVVGSTTSIDRSHLAPPDPKITAAEVKVSTKPYIPDYTVEATSLVQVVRITAAKYAGARRAASLEFHIGAEDATSSIDLYETRPDGSVSPEVCYTSDDGESSMTSKSNSQLLDHLNFHV